jgi:organic radical activating enzyme
MNIHYPVSEIFTSIQGEGNYAGVRCLFIRFQFCNLNCSWCDTKYTWLESTGKFKWFSIDELKNTIEESNVYHVIFTGGEPTFQPLDKLVIPGIKFHVETNATIIPEQPLNMTLRDGYKITRNAMDKKIIQDFNWVVSPKMSNAKQALNSDGMKYWSNADFGIFKFIIKTEQDLQEIKEVVETYNIDNRRIYVGIEGIDLHSQLQPNLVDSIVAYGYNFSPRLHTMLWGAQREK